MRKALHALRALQSRRDDLERRLERRFPKAFDARHAATGIARVLWPLIGPILVALVLLPILALLAGLLALLHVAGIDLPSLGHLPLPALRAPGWLRELGTAIASVAEALAVPARIIFVTGVVLVGVQQTLNARKRRRAAELVGQEELSRRLLLQLVHLEARAAQLDVTFLGELACKQDRDG